MPAEWVPGAAAVIGWIERAAGPGSRVVDVTALPPSGTTQHSIAVALRDGSTRCLMLRRYHDMARLARDPWYVPAHEALALELLAGSPVPAPRLHAADLEAAICDVPALLESLLPGQPAWRPDDIDGYLARTAETLAAIHAVNTPACRDLPAYAPYHARGTQPPSTLRDLGERIARALDRTRPAVRETFIHRDYHPGNVLWNGSRVTGVVDWTTADWGPPGIDLARMRLNLAVHLGGDIADRFAAAYANAGGDPAARHPFWDLLDAADVLPDLDGLTASDRRGREGFETYVERVLAEC